MIFLLILAAFYVIIYVVPQVSDIFVETYSAEYGTLQIKDETTCLLVRTEKTYTAPAGGEVSRVIRRGKLMRASAHIADVGQTACYSDMRGIVSYYYDGLENVCTPDTMDNLKSSVLDQIQDSSENKVKSAAEGTAAVGDILFKIVDNQQWYLVCWLDQDAVSRYSEGAAVTVDFQDGETEEEDSLIEMKVSQVKKQGDQIRIILSCNRYYKDFDRYRTRKCTLITSNTSGILLETDSIVEEDGQKGVYVVDKLGNYHFTPIRILDQDSSVTVAEKNYFYDQEGKAVETVSNYDEILRPGAKAEENENENEEHRAGKEE